LRRGKLLALRVDSIQLREEHWVIADFLQGWAHPYCSDPGVVKVAVDE
jgi:hypothetical protein